MDKAKPGSGRTFCLALFLGFACRLHNFDSEPCKRPMPPCQKVAKSIFWGPSSLNLASTGHLCIPPDLQNTAFAAEWDRNSKLSFSTTISKNRSLQVSKSRPHGVQTVKMTSEGCGDIPKGHHTAPILVYFVTNFRIWRCFFCRTRNHNRVGVDFKGPIVRNG